VARIDGEIVIAAPVEQVFDMVADERNEPRYNPRMSGRRRRRRDLSALAPGSLPSPKEWAPEGS
jgi:uncharacterized protein YndB with AHSA1/START domain